MTITAQHAEYRGVHFRSMSEAVVAWRLDHIGVAWMYEPAWVDLDTGDPYLPDFWLPRRGNEPGCWLEVKGTEGGESDSRLWKAAQLNAEGPRQVLLARIVDFDSAGLCNVLISPLRADQSLPQPFTSPAWLAASQGVSWPRPPARGYLA